MTDFTKTQPAGRMIARLFAKVGWGLAVLGLILALLGALLGRVPGFGGTEGDISLLARLLAMLPGFGLALFGLFSAMMAAQTRAAIDSADIAREMLVLARRRPISLLAAVPPLGEEESATRRAPSQAPPARRDEPEPSPLPALPEFARHVPRPSASSPMPSLSAAREEPSGEARTEPGFGKSARPRPAPGKVHPIFSARPPR